MKHTTNPRQLAGFVAAAAIVAPAALVATAALAQFRTGYPYQSGQDVYEHVCQGCHMPNAKGATGAGAYPALAGNPKLASSAYPALVILRGQKAMPSFADLTDAQVVEVTNYVRSHFGNAYTDKITVDQVKALRPNNAQQGAQRPG